MAWTPWAPLPGPQTEAIVSTWVDELFYGGSRGGGKSEYLLADYLQDVNRYGKHWQGILFRRSLPEMQELIKRSKDLYAPTGGIWFEQAKEWRWTNGAVLRFRYLEHVRDSSRYQGHEYQWIGWDELTQWSNDEAYKAIMACLRCSEADVKTKRVRCSGNPGGPGHQWVKARFVDINPMGYVPLKDGATGMIRMYIPARVTDNQILLQRDPKYIDRLRGVGSEALVKAWLDGDWNQVTGAYFNEFNSSHIIQPFSIPHDWTKFRSMDWGSARPFSVGWWAVSDGSNPQYPKNALIRYREWYGASAPNVGLKLPVPMVARGILERGPERIDYSVIDPATLHVDGGPSIWETFLANGVRFKAADNARLAGWQQIRDRLTGEDGKPMIYIFSTCKDLIRTLPAAQHSVTRPEDLDTEGEDHALDEMRYACMSRPYVKPNNKTTRPVKLIHDITLDELWACNKPTHGASRI